MRNYEESLMAMKAERINEYKKWGKELPSFNFDKEWDVKIIPPFGNAIIRFYIEHNGKHVSIYFDAYSELGYMYDTNGNPIPYFEYYDGEECYRYHLNENEQMMKDVREFLNS